MSDVTTQRLLDELKIVIADTQELLHATVEETDAKISHARERAAESLRTARATQRRIVRKADRYIHARPWSTLGIVAATAFIAGLISAKR